MAQPRYNDSLEEERSLALPMLHLNSGDRSQIAGLLSNVTSANRAA